MGNEKNNKKQAYQEEKLTFSGIFQIIKKHFIPICILGVLGIAGGFSLGLYKDNVKPRYTASASILITAENGTVEDGTTTQYQLSSFLMKTYSAFVKEDVVIDKVVERANAVHGEGYTTSGGIKSNFSSSISNDSLIINTFYTARSESEAVEILNYILECSVETANALDSNGEPVYKLLNKNISILTRASEKHVSKKIVLTEYTLKGLAIGLVLALTYVVVFEVTNTKFSSVSEIERELGIPVLAGVPEFELKENGGKKNVIRK